MLQCENYLLTGDFNTQTDSEFAVLQSNMINSDMLEWEAPLAVLVVAE